MMLNDAEKGQKPKRQTDKNVAFGMLPGLGFALRDSQLCYGVIFEEISSSFLSLASGLSPKQRNGLRLESNSSKLPNE